MSGERLQRLCAELEELCPGAGPLIICLQGADAYYLVAEMPGARIELVGAPALTALSRADVRIGRVEVTAIHRGCTQALHEAIAGHPEAFERETFDSVFFGDDEGRRYETRHCNRCASTVTRVVREPAAEAATEAGGQ